jgi:hypothetical protein
LALIGAGANRHDVTQLGPVLDAMVIASTDKGASFLYADKGYAGEPAQEVLTCRGYALRVNGKKRQRGRPWKNRRWVVEAAHSWFNRFRKLLVMWLQFNSTSSASPQRTHL